MAVILDEWCESLAHTVQNSFLVQGPAFESICPFPQLYAPELGASPISVPYDLFSDAKNLKPTDFI